ncbi:anhydro-N-acetylmuramic acid kinase [Pararhodospirillum oryzae]|uniref:Anhydro-N-acetylmuramic acid kinase n=1 Tax=Pararhodospirillum oryzae TaxID=478448 RepID=A0A512H6V4_9PROT|nr:anhydro-N-acetylmuramic acid kinase [Pararhodospirillum oryzae]GEO81161.1 anhydro-N-acetylmuramic acid kinase [Pararhodospirillum oryzae]
MALSSRQAFSHPGLDAPLWALGLMSGTSLDGIDAALVRTDGERVLDLGPALTVPYDGDLRARLRAALGRSPADQEAGLPALVRDLTERHAQAARRLLAASPFHPGVIGFHGQTLFHAPDEGITVQIGDGALLAALTGVAVVNDFRSADVAAGGQGAPLAPAWHQALAASLPGPVAVLNIGGVANVTWIAGASAPGTPPLAFDTGPGNALIDDWVRGRLGLPHDAGGRLGAAGRVDGVALAALMDHPYFDRRPPKSLDRDAFSLDPVASLTDADGAATLVAFTSAAVAAARRWMPAPPARWLVCGGGRHNASLMARLGQDLAVPVEPVETVGWQGDALEAQAFAFLAVRALRGLPLSWPSTTGVPAPLSGGRYWPADGPLSGPGTTTRPR